MFIYFFRQIPSNDKINQTAIAVAPILLSQKIVSKASKSADYYGKPVQYNFVLQLYTLAPSTTCHILCAAAVIVLIFGLPKLKVSSNAI
jgi:hypothetical protein